MRVRVREREEEGEGARRLLEFGCRWRLFGHKGGPAKGERRRRRARVQCCCFRRSIYQMGKRRLLLGRDSSNDLQLYSFDYFTGITKSGRASERAQDKLGRGSERNAIRIYLSEPPPPPPPQSVARFQPADLLLLAPMAAHSSARNWRPHVGVSVGAGSDPLCSDLNPAD